MRRFMTVAAEQIADLVDRSTEDGRLSRAKALFRKGSVTDLVVSEGSIVARVRGSEGDRYEATIATAPAPAHVAAEIARAHDPGDRWSLDDLVSDGLDLCPREIDLAFTCDCADWEEPCKHVAATFLAFADRVDLDQADLLRWRGVDPNPTPDPGPSPTAAPTPPTTSLPRPDPVRRSSSPAARKGPGADARRSDNRAVGGGRVGSGDRVGEADGEPTDGPGEAIDRATRLSELESLLGDTVVRVDGSGSSDPEPGDAPVDQALHDFLGVGRSIDPADPVGIEATAPLFAEIQLGPLADLGPELADALALIRTRLDQA